MTCGMSKTDRGVRLGGGGGKGVSDVTLSADSRGHFSRLRDAQIQIVIQRGRQVEF